MVLDIKENGLIFGYKISRNGHAQSIGWDEVGKFEYGDEIIWLHLDYTDSHVKKWLFESSHLDKITASILQDEDTRPRTIINDDNIIVCLRALNMNEEEDPEDMVAIRIYIDRNKIITTRNRPLKSVTSIQESLESKNGPKSTSELF